MRPNPSPLLRRPVLFAVLIALVVALAPLGHGQQVLQRGALGTPSQVFDETQQWTSPIPVATGVEQDVYIPDVSTVTWLNRNYADYANKGVYTISVFTQYKRAAACRRDMIGWGFSDAAHLDACIDIGYRVRELTVDITQKTITLNFAAMLNTEGQLMQDTSPVQSATRGWAELDAGVRGALARTNQMVADQMRAYDRKMRGVH